MLDFQVTDNNIHIVDSYEIKSKMFVSMLSAIKKMYPNSLVWNRTMRSLSNEWAAHNLIYKIGLFRDHTKDVDLDYPQKWYFKVAYCIVGTIAKLFV